MTKLAKIHPNFDVDMPLWKDDLLPVIFSHLYTDELAVIRKCSRLFERIVRLRVINLAYVNGQNFKFPPFGNYRFLYIILTTEKNARCFIENIEHQMPTCEMLDIKYLAYNDYEKYNQRSIRRDQMIEVLSRITSRKLFDVDIDLSPFRDNTALTSITLPLIGMLKRNPQIRTLSFKFYMLLETADFGFDEVISMPQIESMSFHYGVPDCVAQEFSKIKSEFLYLELMRPGLTKCIKALHKNRHVKRLRIVDSGGFLRTQYIDYIPALLMENKTIKNLSLVNLYVVPRYLKSLLAFFATDQHSVEYLYLENMPIDEETIPEFIALLKNKRVKIEMRRIRIRYIEETFLDLIKAFYRGIIDNRVQIANFEFVDDKLKPIGTINQWVIPLFDVIFELDQDWIKDNSNVLNILKERQY